MNKKKGLLIGLVFGIILLLTAGWLLFHNWQLNLAKHPPNAPTELKAEVMRSDVNSGHQTFHTATSPA